jgi:hypothetical protein
VSGPDARRGGRVVGTAVAGPVLVADSPGADQQRLCAGSARALSDHDQAVPELQHPARATGYAQGAGDCLGRGAGDPCRQPRMAVEVERFANTGVPPPSLAPAHCHMTLYLKPRLIPKEGVLVRSHHCSWQLHLYQPDGPFFRNK